MTTLQFKIKLIGTNSPVWRRILVDNKTTLDEFHYIIQIAMGWSDTNFHNFLIDSKVYMNIEIYESDSGLANESLFKLKDVITRPKQEINYFYDTRDDGWENEIIFEKSLPDLQLDYPKCIDGNGECPPEECGGIEGYNKLLGELEDSNISNSIGYKEIFGMTYDSIPFDLDLINLILKEFTDFPEFNGRF